MRLWTFQRPEVVAGFPQGRAYWAPWSGVPDNWRPAYRWMAQRLADATGSGLDHAPVWCWHSANGSDEDDHVTVRGAAPTMVTARDLTGGDCQVILLELDVPEREVLLSSYWEWNEVLEQFLLSGEVGSAHAAEMFSEPLLAFPEDDIQAVIDRIEPGWIRSRDCWDVPA